MSFAGSFARSFTGGHSPGRRMLYCDAITSLIEDLEHAWSMPAAPSVFTPTVTRWLSVASRRSLETLPRTSALDRPGLLASIADAVTRIFFARPRGSQVDDRLRKPIRVLIGNPQGRVCRAFDLNRRMVPMRIDTLSPRFGRELQTVDGYRELTE